MSKQAKQWGAIIAMIALFAMIAFVTNLCSPMGVIVKNEFGCSNLLAMIGNYGNFGAYLLMGIPSGIMITKYGYKKTALIGLIVGIVGILIQWASGAGGFLVYLIGALISGACMCILNTVVNPMLNLLGGGGKSGNQLIQTGGVFNSAAAVAVYIIMGALIGEATKAKISDATPALLIALGIFVLAFLVILFTKIDEPQQPVAETAKKKDKYSAWSFRHFVLGALAIGIYGSIEMGPPGFILQYLTSDTQEIVDKKVQLIESYNADKLALDDATMLYLNAKYVVAENDTFKIAAPEDATADVANMFKALDSLNVKQDVLAITTPEVKNNARTIQDTRDKMANKEITIEAEKTKTLGRGLSAGYAGSLGAVYFIFMLIGRFVGASVGSKISSKAMITTVALFSVIFLALGIFLPETTTVGIPGINYVGGISFISEQVPICVLFFLLVGLCASVMWGGIFNLATEGLGKYTAMASGIFMTMVCGFAIMMGVQGFVADLTGSYVTSFFVPLAAGLYILWYARIGSKNVNKDIPVE